MADQSSTTLLGEGGATPKLFWYFRELLGFGFHWWSFVGELGREKKKECGAWWWYYHHPQSITSKRAEAKTQGWADMHNSKRKGYIPRITASRHFIGRASLVISLARSISLQSRTRERWGQLKGLCYALWPVQPFCTTGRFPGERVAHRG